MDWVFGIELTLFWLGIMMLLVTSLLRRSNPTVVLVLLVVTTVVVVLWLFQAVSYDPENSTEDSEVVALAVGFGSLALATFGAGLVAFVRQRNRNRHFFVDDLGSGDGTSAG